MRSWNPPTPEQIARVRALVAQPSQYRYFFERLENPAWVKPLWDSGFFRTPPELERDVERGTIGFPPWPESRYLLRMSTNPVAHDDVLAVVSALPPTDNERVIEDIVDIALNIPADDGIRLAGKALEWARGPLYLLLPDKIGDLCVHYSQAGYRDEAFSLARELLQPQPDPRAGREGEHSVLLRPEPSAKFDLWNYEKVLQKIGPALAALDGIEAIRLFSDLLDCTLVLSRKPNEDHFEDVSVVWRPAIEDHSQNRNKNLASLLVTVVRDVSDQVALTDRDHTDLVLSELSRHHWTVYRRICLHVAHVALDLDPQPAIDLLMREELLRESGIRHEYLSLLRDALPVLPSDVSQEILGWIRGGPDLTNFRAQRGIEDEEDERRYCSVWQRDILSFIREQLSPEDREFLDDLESRFGPAEHPDFPVWSDGTVFAGPTSPLESDDLASMTMTTIASYLKAWKPTPGWLAPSPSGLGRSLAKAVKQNAEQFSAESLELRGVDATYIREFFAGLREALKEGQTIAWGPVLDLSSWVVEQPRDIPDRSGDPFDEDPHWGWARKAMMDLVGAGLAAEHGSLNLENRDRVWEVIAQVLQDPDPTPEHEARYGGSNMDPATLSINTARGEAAHTAVRYGLWIHRQLDPSDQSRGLDAMPELRAAFEDRLAADPSTAVRAVFGQWLPWLFLLDESWTTSHLGHIFPTSEGTSHLWRAAWNTYVVFCNVFNRPFSLLSDQYRMAIEQLRMSEVATTHLRDPVQRLAEHLMIAYGRGLIDLEPDGLLVRFYEVATVDLRRHCLKFIGTSVSGERELPPAVVERLLRFWSWRRDELGGHSDDELAGFGSWPASGAFDAEWSLIELEGVLKRVDNVDAAHELAKSLVAAAGDYPDISVRCLHLLLQGDKQSWHIHAWRGEIREILVTASKQGAGVVAREVIDWLGRNGHLEFRDLLDQVDG